MTGGAGGGAAGPEPPQGYEELNRYARVIVDAALDRGIHVEVLDASIGELALSLDRRRITTVESLSELTNAVAFRRCDHKGQTRRVLQAAGLRLPAGRMATFDEGDLEFLAECKDIVVKPARGEGGHGVTVGVVDRDGLATALQEARAVWPEVLLEQRCEGEDLRLVVIDGEVVAAAVRRPATVTGTGEHTLAELVEALDRSRDEATDGASRIAVDDATRDMGRAGGYELDSVVPEGTEVALRRTANLHTGGTIHDVTEELHPDLAAVAVEAARAIGIPVLGVDLMVPAVDGPDYLIIEANEQPGLANHEPQPTAERFIDLLFGGKP